MCPDGAEGTTYAILTTMSNVAMAAASNIGTMFTVIWDVDNDTFRCRTGRACLFVLEGLVCLTLI